MTFGNFGRYTSQEHLRLDTQFIIYRGTCSCVANRKEIQRRAGCQLGLDLYSMWQTPLSCQQYRQSDFDDLRPIINGQRLITCCRMQAQPCSDRFPFISRHKTVTNHDSVTSYPFRPSHRHYKFKEVKRRSKLV